MYLPAETSAPMNHELLNLMITCVYISHLQWGQAENSLIKMSVRI